MKILIADDSLTMRFYLTRLLTHLGHEVVAATDGQEAWTAFQQAYYPVVISDWHMPGLDGLGLAARMRSRPTGPYSYLILITSDDAEEHYAKGIAAGADDFLQKPCKESYLAARLMVAERIVTMQNHTRQLEALMSVCSYCKNIRGQDNQWVRMEDYAAQQFGMRSSHGICPSCFQTRVKPEMEQLGIKVDDLDLK
jgi:DNA-binding response OmpR family regulator